MGNVSVKYIGRLEYSQAWELQRTLFYRLLRSKEAGESGEQTLLLVEHPHVYTLGKSGHESNLLVNEDFLR